MNAQERFWNWFIQHEVQILDFESDQERIFDQLAVELQRIDPNLSFEFGPKEARREFVISASGVKSSFPAVASTVAAAPNLDHWKVTAFRPRRTTPNVVEFRGRRIHPKDVRFSLISNGKSVGIYLFIPGLQEGDADLKQIGYQLLDDALGEFDVESRLGLIKMLPPDVRTEGARYPLAELSARFDELISELGGHSERPS
jgi:hypothetical protein